MDVTAEVSQLDRSPWLNTEASRNILLISVTSDVSQDEIFPLKADAPSNMDLMFLTAEVFHLDTSWLNDDALETERLIKESIEIENKLSYSYGPPVIQKPTHELYGEWLLGQNRFEEAITQFDLTLKMATNRRQALEGKTKAMTSI